MHDIILSQQQQRLGHLEYNLPNFILILPQPKIKLFIMYSIHFLTIKILPFQFVKGIAQGITTFLVQDPGVFFVDEVVIKFYQVLNPWAVQELLLWAPSELKEVGSEPDLFNVRLVAALCNDLLGCVLLLAFLVFA